MKEETRDIFIHEKPTLIAATLLEENKMHVREISREIDATYSHTVRLMNRMHENELVKSQKSGRKKLYRLTEDGRELAKGLTKIFEPEREYQVARRKKIPATL